MDGDRPGAGGGPRQEGDGWISDTAMKKGWLGGWKKRSEILGSVGWLGGAATRERDPTDLGIGQRRCAAGDERGRALAGSGSAWGRLQVEIRPSGKRWGRWRSGERGELGLVLRSGLGEKVGGCGRR